MDADVSATAQRGSCLLTERVSFNTQQALLSYPDRAITTHRNSVTGKEALTNRNWKSLRVHSCFDIQCLEMCISNCSQRWRGSWKEMTKKKKGIEVTWISNYSQVKIVKICWS